MRQKRIKYVDESLLATHGVIIDLCERDFPDQPLEIEIGSGKGEFITRLAADNKDKHYIAIERNKYVCYRIVEKKEALKLNNLTIILGDAINLNTYLGRHKVDAIYLNFSDPWPKKRHHKRRLTAPSFLPIYQHLLDDNGILQFRTDHFEFFIDSLENLSSTFDIMHIDKDLAVSNYMTEYEVKKRLSGPIYQIQGRKKHVTQTL